MSKVSNKWIWPDVGNSSGHSHTQPDSFNSSKDLTNVIREATQNSVDAAQDNNHDKCKLEFDIIKNRENLSQYFNGIIEFRDESGASTNINKHLTDLLVIKDTSGGLIGDIQGSRDSNFWKFMLDWGDSNKDGSGLGAKGRGRISFPYASDIDCVMVATKRENNDNVICGMGILKPIMSPDNKRMDSQAIFAAEATNTSTFTPHDNFDQMIEDFGINFNSGLGTAIVIPYPRAEVVNVFKETVIATIIENFAPMIMRNNLEVTVCGERLNIQNIKEKTKDLLEKNLDLPYKKRYFDKPDFRENGDEFIEFLNDAITELYNKPTYSIDIHNNEINSDTFSKEQKEVITNILNEGTLLTICLNINIFDEDGVAIPCSIETAFRSPGAGRKGIERYHRRGMVMQDQRKHVEPAYHCGLFVKDPEISKVLNRVENTGHTQWVLQSGDAARLFKDKKTIKTEKLIDHKEAEKVVRLCQQALKLIINHGLIKDSMVDTSSLAKFFPAYNEVDPQPEDPREPDSDGGDQGPEDPIETEPRDYIYTHNNNGYSLKYNGSDLPNSISVKMFYDNDHMIGGKTIKHYDFPKNKIKIKAVNCNAEIHQNHLYISELEKDFKVDATGFNKDLEMLLDIKQNNK